MTEALSSSGTSVLTRATRRNIPEDAILYSHRRENLKFYILGLLRYSVLETHRILIGEINFYEIPKYFGNDSTREESNTGVQHYIKP
jgi:hypothetical protein